MSIAENVADLDRKILDRLTQIGAQHTYASRGPTTIEWTGRVDEPHALRHARWLCERAREHIGPDEDHPQSPNSARMCLGQASGIALVYGAITEEEILQYIEY